MPFGLILAAVDQLTDLARRLNSNFEFATIELSRIKARGTQRRDSYTLACSGKRSITFDEFEQKLISTLIQTESQA